MGLDPLLKGRGFFVCKRIKKRIRIKGLIMTGIKITFLQVYFTERIMKRLFTTFFLFASSAANMYRAQMSLDTVTALPLATPENNIQSGTI